MKEERLKICGGCEHFKVNICKKCFCIIPIKVQYPSAKCPLNKW
jgi:hypothetical protein